MISEFINKIFNNKYTSTILTMFLVLYGGLAGPKLHPVVKSMFKESLFRIIVLALIVYNGNRNIKLSISIAILFLVSMQHLADNEIENFANQDQCYLKCMNDTMSYLSSSKHYEKIKKMEDWFQLNKHIIDNLQKDNEKKIDLSKIWKKTKNTSEYMSKENIYNNNVLHQEIMALLEKKKEVLTQKEGGVEKYKELFEKLKEGHKLIQNTITKYTVSSGCKDSCKPN